MHRKAHRGAVAQDLQDDIAIGPVAAPERAVHRRQVGGQVHIVRLSADSPAEAAGLQPKDVIVAIDGVRVAADSHAPRPVAVRAAPSPLRSPPSEREGPAPLGPFQ